eukprot:gb/GECG01001889.1/.p1 GENE.gb/GECG01001889.1/~~gb/GECG01001889.1/.p1  ORF type:complete len:734 (+),score=46.81 gb/GECG01001889.1/:1-2202(+)
MFPREQNEHRSLLETRNDDGVPLVDQASQPRPQQDENMERYQQASAQEPTSTYCSIQEYGKGVSAPPPCTVSLHHSAVRSQSHAHNPPHSMQPSGPPIFPGNQRSEYHSEFRQSEGSCSQAPAGVPIQRGMMTSGQNMQNPAPENCSYSHQHVHPQGSPGTLQDANGESAQVQGYPVQEGPRTPQEYQRTPSIATQGYALLSSDAPPFQLAQNARQVPTQAPVQDVTPPAFHAFQQGTPQPRFQVPQTGYQSQASQERLYQSIPFGQVDASRVRQPQEAHVGHLSQTAAIGQQSRNVQAYAPQRGPGQRVGFEHQKQLQPPQEANTGQFAQQAAVGQQPHDIQAFSPQGGLEHQTRMQLPHLAYQQGTQPNQHQFPGAFGYDPHSELHRRPGEALEQEKQVQRFALSKQHVERIGILRRITVVLCFVFISIAIGIPKWGKCGIGDESLHYGLIQAKTEEETSCLHFVVDNVYDEPLEGELKTLRNKFDAGRVLAALSFIPVLVLLRKFKTFRGAAIATAIVGTFHSRVAVNGHTVYSSIVVGICIAVVLVLSIDILMSTVVHDIDMVDVIDVLAKFGNSDTHRQLFGLSCGPDTSFILYSTALSFLCSMLAILCAYLFYEYQQASKVAEENVRTSLLPPGGHVEIPVQGMGSMTHPYQRSTVPPQHDGRTSQHPRWSTQGQSRGYPGYNPRGQPMPSMGRYHHAVRPPKSNPSLPYDDRFSHAVSYAPPTTGN